MKNGSDIVKMQIRAVWRKRKMNESLNSAKKDIAIILSISFVSAILYIILGKMIMYYGHDISHSLLFRFLPVFLIQFGIYRKELRTAV